MEAVEPHPFRVNPDVRVEVGLDRRRAEDWAGTYLDAFYGERSLLPTVTRVVERISPLREASLFLARLRGEPAGVLALFRTGEICGVYCVGTSPGSRGARVASTMLKVAADVAAGERRKLVLQTILSDSVESLYTKLGFERLYLKDIFAKSGTGGLGEG
jgi:GNAT superfamily N-acetyltransferase